jgi:hypothetical protein
VAENKIKLVTKIQTFDDVQRSLQSVEKTLNKLSEAINKKAEEERKETEGKSGDTKTINEGTNAGNDYSFEVKTDKGWQSPILRPHYDSGWVAVEKGATTTYTFKHNLGTQMLLIQGYFKEIASDGGKIYAFGDSSEDYGDATPVTEFHITMNMSDLNSLILGVGNDHIFSGDLGTVFRRDSGFMRLLLWKTGLTR